MKTFYLPFGSPCPRPSLIHLNSALMREASWNCFKHLGQSRKYPHTHRCWPPTSGAGGRRMVGKLEARWKCALSVCPGIHFCLCPICCYALDLWLPDLVSEKEQRWDYLVDRKEVNLVHRVNEEVLGDRWKGCWTWVPGTSNNYRCSFCMCWRLQTLVLCT